MVTIRPYIHSPEEDEGEQPWTIRVPVSLPVQPKPAADTAKDAEVETDEEIEQAE